MMVAPSVSQLPSAPPGSHVFGSLQSSAPTPVQSTALPPPQTPAVQVSPSLQARPSSQGAVLFGKKQPVAGSHRSSVQTLPSLHVSGVPETHMFPTQVSIPSQTSPLSQSASFLQQPGIGVPGVHSPPRHVSAPLHTSPSSHDVPSVAKLS